MRWNGWSGNCRVFVGLWLALGFFGTTAVTGLAASGQISQFFEERGRPHHIAAQIFGFGISEIAMTGLIQLRERENPQCCGDRTPASPCPFSTSRTARESLESLPLVRSATVRKLYPDGVVINVVERETLRPVAGGWRRLCHRHGWGGDRLFSAPIRAICRCRRSSVKVRRRVLRNISN